MFKPFLKKFLTCKLCWTITLVIFIALLTIEGLLLIPLYQHYRHQYSQMIDRKAKAVMKTLLTLHKQDIQTLQLAGNKISKETILKGASVYNSKGKIIAQFGFKPQLTPSDLQKLGDGHAYYNTQHVYRLWKPEQLHSPYEVVAIVDKGAMQHLLRYFLKSYMDDTIIIAFVLTLVTMIIISLLILKPLLYARRQLIRAIKHPADPKRYLINVIPNNELGEVFNINNKLLIKISHFLQRLRIQREKLYTLNKSLDFKVKQRTRELSTSNENLKKENIHRRKVEKELWSMALFPKEDTNPVLRIDANGTIIYANIASQPLLNIWKVKVDDNIPTDWYRLIKDALTVNTNKTIELACENDFYLLNIVPIVDQNYVNIYGININDRKQYEEQLHFLSGHDAVTQLVNRLLFEQLLDQEIREAQPECFIAVLFIEINDFQAINQTLGHQVGDELLKQIADKLKQRLPKQFILAHFGTNHFSIAIPELTNAKEADNYAAKLFVLFKEVFYINKQELHISINIGIAIYPLDADDSKNLIKNADLAMFHARAKGQNRSRFFTETMNKDLEAQHQLYQDLHLAIEQQQLLLYCQPQLDLKTNKIIGVETLLRWQHPKLGMVKPEQFIPLLEQSHLMDELTEWMFVSALQQHKKWRKHGLTPMRMSVNLTADQLQNPNLVIMLERILKKCDVPAEYLEIEIIERTAITEPELTKTILTKIDRLGIKVAIDDFGTDYSSLRYLHQLPIHKIKIDRSFMQGLLKNSDSQIILNAMINLAHNLNLIVLVEGIETQAQLTYLAEHHCDEIQGYLLAKPMPSDEFVSFYQSKV